MNNYEEIPHVEFKGFRIYMAENKIDTIRRSNSWTYSKIQMQFKIGFNAAKLLIEYAQSIGVLGCGMTNGNGTRFEVLK